MSQAEWNAARAKLQSGPDYVMVRRSAQAGQFAGDKKGGQDGIAINWFEINKLDLPAATGGKAYDDTVIKKDLADLQDEVDVLQDQVDAIVVPDTSSLATKKELTDAVKVLQDQIDAIKAGGGGGDGFDPTELIADIDALAKDLSDLEDAVDVDTAAIAKNTADVKNLWTVNGDRKNETTANADAITALQNNKVELAAGQSMLTIWRGSTSEYDAITHDPNTLYIVTP
tara:strand:+ start:172 stop:855 length:684 start_codon:yes stop_codon:yes gene_type:complete